MADDSLPDWCHAIIRALIDNVDKRNAVTTNELRDAVYGVINSHSHFKHIQPSYTFQMLQTNPMPGDTASMELNVDKRITMVDGAGETSTPIQLAQVKYEKLVDDNDTFEIDIRFPIVIEQCQWLMRNTGGGGEVEPRRSLEEKRETELRDNLGSTFTVRVTLHWLEK